MKLLYGPTFALDALEANEAQGTLAIPYTLTGPGVFHYMIGGKRVGVLKPPEAWHADSFLRSAARAPITIEHPREGSKVSRANIARVTVGIADSGPATVRADGYVRHGGTLFSPVAVAQVTAKQDPIRAVSAGFFTRLQEQTGVWTAADGAQVPYEAVQLEPVVNHVALTRQPRVLFATIGDADGVAVWVPTMRSLHDILAALAADSTLADSLTKLLADKDAEIAAAKAARDRAQALADSARDTAADEAALRTRVKARVELLSQARALAPTLATDALVDRGDAEVLQAVLAARGVKVAADASVDYLRGRVEALAPLTAQNSVVRAIQAAPSPQTSQRSRADIDPAGVYQRAADAARTERERAKLGGEI